MGGWTPKIRVFRQGHEQEPVIVVDDCIEDPEEMIADASALEYQPNGPYFPGVRAVAPPDVVASLRESVADLLKSVFGVGEELNRIESYYSLVTTPPSQLQILQRLPHFDGLGRQRIALVHHLGRAEKGGTAFYRHRSTGFETMTTERLPAYNAAVNTEMLKHGVPPARYASKETPFYEQIAYYPARFNRMLIYRGATLHSADIPDDVPLTDSPATGRFSLNTFIWLEP